MCIPIYDRTQCGKPACFFCGPSHARCDCQADFRVACGRCMDCRGEYARRYEVNGVAGLGTEGRVVTGEPLAATEYVEGAGGDSWERDLDQKVFKEELREKMMEMGVWLEKEDEEAGKWEDKEADRETDGGEEEEGWE